MADGNTNWYVVRAISGKEGKVKEFLEKACENNADLARNIEQVLVPTEKVYTTRGGKKVLKDKTLLSGYVFVKCYLGEGVEDFIVNTTNVINFIRERGAAKRPEEISEAQIQRMLGTVVNDEALAPDATPNDFIVGETVKVTYGPFNGFSGEIEEVNREKRKLKVSVKVFGRKTPLELDNSQVERE